MKTYEIILQPGEKLIAGHETTKNCGCISPGDSQKHRYGDHEWIRKHRHYFRKNEVVLGIDTHYLESIDLLRNSHGTNAGRNKRSNLTRHDNGDKCGSEFQNDRLSRCERNQ